jgi:predicted nucleic acid-binding protein
MKTEQLPTEPHDSTNQQVFVDTNIFLYAGSKDRHRSEAVLKCLEEIGALGYKLAISEYTTYESLINIWGKKAEETISALKRYEKRKEVTNQILRLAAILRGLYHDEKIENIGDGDIII